MHEWIPVDSILLQALLKLHRLLPPQLLGSCHFLQCIWTVQHMQAHQGMENEIHTTRLCHPIPESQVHGHH